MRKKKNIWLYLSFVLTICIAISFFSNGLDYYWHVKIGSYIVNNLKIPYVDIFSWYGTLNNLHWISHEWLYECLIYGFKYLFGNTGSLIYTFLVLFGISSIIYKYNKKYFEKNTFYTILLAITGLIVLGFKLFPRPHLLSYLFFTITLYFAYDLLNNPKSKKIYFSILISILWANFHGGSSNLSYIVYLMILCINLFSIKYKKISNKKLNKEQILKYLYAIITSFIGIIINPHGFKMIIYPYINLTYKIMIECIEEWGGITFNGEGKIYIVLILILIFIFIKELKKKEKISLTNLLITIIFIIMGIRSVKFFPYLYLFICFYIPKSFKKNRFYINPMIVSIVLIVANIFFIFSYKEKKLVSDEIIDYIKDNKIERLYNSYDLGGYLIYKDIKPFIDGRADMYVKSNFKDACYIEQGRDFELINKYDFDYFVIYKNSKLSDCLSKKDNYELVIDGKEVILVKKINKEEK